MFAILRFILDFTSKASNTQKIDNFKKSLRTEALSQTEKREKDMYSPSYMY